MTPIICPNCRAELTEYKRFCPECGARLPEEAAPAATPPAVAPTVILPPAEPPVEPQPAAVAPTARLDAPEPAPRDDTPTVVGGVQPANPLPPLPPIQQPAPQPPAGYNPLPPGTAYTQVPPAEASPPNRRNLWILLGGVGCLSLVLVGACVAGVLISLGNLASAEIGVGAPTPVVAVESGGAGGGIIPNDTPLTGGDVLLQDDFDNAAASGLGESEDDASRYAYENGAYVIEVKEPETIVWARVGGSYDDARISVDATVPPGTDVASAGLIFHYQDEDNFYLFSVSNDGYYALELLQNNEWTVLIDWTPSDAVGDSSNRMRVETSGDRIALYVNDELLEETSDSTFGEGEVALAVTSLQDSTALVEFDNLVIERNE